MDSLIARLLSVHVTRLLPPGAAELNISPLTQTTGLLGIGLLYYGSRHRRMSEVMLSEIENSTSEERSGDEPILRDEGYRLAAGFALGLINLGYGNQLQGLQDMSLLERLLKIAIGTKNIDLVHVLDRATAGAVVAVALIYMKTNDRAVARKIDIPDTVHQFDYVRADIFLLRTLARHLILWDAVEPAIAFVQRSLPQIYRHRADLANTKYLSTEDLPFYNILTGICFAIGLRFAGSQRFDVRDILVAYLDQFLRLVKLPAPNYDARVTMNNVRNCLDVVALASATVMAGSGDLVVLRRLRALHGRTDKETPFGSHLAAHMAIGALFLGGGTTTFGSSNLAVACLLIAFYPMFPADALDNRNHLQAFRHLWVLAVEGRCLVARDAETRVVIGGLEARVHLNSGKQVNVRAPGLLPEFHLISSIDVSGEGYWDLRIDMKNRAVKGRCEKEFAVDAFMRKRAAFDKPMTNAFASEMQALSEVSKIPSVNPHAASNHHLASHSSQSPNAFDWLFELESLKDLDHAERALVVNHNHTAGTISGDLLKGTATDTRLYFEKGILTEDGSEMSRDKLWQLRLLLAWMDRFELEDEELVVKEGKNAKDSDKWLSSVWIRSEVVERLRERVWLMANGQGVDA